MRDSPLLRIQVHGRKYAFDFFRSRNSFSNLLWSCSRREWPIPKCRRCHHMRHIEPQNKAAHEDLLLLCWQRVPNRDDMSPRRSKCRVVLACTCSVTFQNSPLFIPASAQNPYAHMLVGRASSFAAASLNNKSSIQHLAAAASVADAATQPLNRPTSPHPLCELAHAT